MNLAMSIITEEMQNLSATINEAMSELENACATAQKAWENNWLAVTQKMSIVSLHAKVKSHLDSGKNGLAQAIQTYENTNAVIKREIDGTYSIEVSTGNDISVPSTKQNANGQYEVTVEKVPEKVTYSIPYERIQAKLCEVQGNRQIKRDNGGPGRCETVSLVTLIRRRMVLDGKNPDELGYSVDEKDYVSRTDFHTGTGNTVYNNKISQAANSILEANTTKNIDSGTPVVGKKYAGYELKSSSERSQDGIVKLLQQHPEGLQVAMNYSNPSIYHKIVISDYSINTDGSYQFYVYDGVNGQSRTTLEESWIWKAGWKYTNKSAESFLNNLEYVRYLE